MKLIDAFAANMDKQTFASISEVKIRLKELWREEKLRRCRKPMEREQHLVYRTTLRISPAALEQINKFLSAKRENEYQGEDNTITYTVRFPDGKEMDIKCCGCRDEPSWTEAVLFDERGCQIACSNVGEDFDGSWELEVDGTRYIVEALVSDSEKSCV